MGNVVENSVVKSETSPVIDAKTFDEDAEQFVMSCYDEAIKRHSQLHPINVENNEFYEGIDRELESRKDNPLIKRASIYVPEIKPAIDTRISKVMSHVEESLQSVTVMPLTKDVSDEDRAQLLWIQHNLNIQLREIGYLTDVFREQITAAEINRSPSFVKVGWEERWERKAIKIPPVASTLQFMQQVAMSFMGGGQMPQALPRVRYERQYQGGRPYVIWKEPGRILYEPNVSDFKEDSVYVMDADYVEYNKLMSMAKQEGWDVEKIQRYKEEIVSGSETSMESTTREEVEASKGTAFSEGTKDGKILLIEAVVVSYADDGEKQYNDVVMVGGKYQVHNQLREDNLIGFPYVNVVSNRMPGTIESMSSVDVVKPQQRLFNEAFNMWLDALTYRTFPPLKAPRNFRFREAPVWGPLRIWYCSDPERLTAVVDNPGDVPDLPPLMNAISMNIRNTLNSPDVDQGNTTQQYQKAATAQIKFLGSATRSVPTFKDYGMTLARVAMMCIQLNQQHAIDKHNWVVNSGMKTDVPSLTGISNPQQTKADLTYLYQEAKVSPVYASPKGRVYMRNLFEDIVRHVAPNDISRFVPTEKEITDQLTLEAKQKQLMMDRLDLERAKGNQPTEQIPQSTEVANG